jgi:predicted MFS family arabinose efflux permease
MAEPSSRTAQKTSGKAWLMFIVIFILCFVTPIIWFSAPAMHNSIAGLAVNGTFLQEPGYDIFVGNLANQALFGQTMSLIGLFGFFSAIIAGFLVKRIGVKWNLAIGAAFVVIAAVLSAMSDRSYDMLLVGRSCIGVAIGFIWVASPTALSFWFPEKRRALAMGIWGACVPIGALASTNIIVNPMLNAEVDFHVIWWVMAAISAIAFLLVLFIYRDPKTDVGSDVSTQALPFREVLKFFKQHQIYMIIIVWMAFNFINSCFTSYNEPFFQDSLGMDRNEANVWFSVASGAGICAPIFGFIADKINRYRRWILLSIGALCLTLTGVLGFHESVGPFSGGILMAIYLVVLFAANGILISTCRPFIPQLLARGGATAVSLGFSALTLLQFFVQFFTAPIFGGIQDSVILSGGTSAEAWSTAAGFAIIPLGIVALICTFFIRQKDPSKTEK